MSPMLEVRDLAVRHGELLAVTDVDLDIPSGAVVGLIGPNGAGKTSTIDAISGFVAPTRGVIRLDGRDVTGLTAHRRARLGLGRTFQALDLFEDLTVRQNLAVAAGTPGLRDTLLDTLRPRPRDRRRVDDALETVGIGDLADRHPPDLSNGQRHLVALARTLAARPRVVLLDEPAAGLDETETTELAGVIRRLAEADVGVLLVDHDMTFVMGICDVVNVLDIGRTIATGAPAEVRADPAVIAAYLGDAERGDGGEATMSPDHTEPTATSASASSPPTADPVRSDTVSAPMSATVAPILEVRGLHAGHDGVPVVHGLDLEVGPGEVLTLLGANGAGKTTTLLTISGLLRALDGHVSFAGEVVVSPDRRSSPARAAALTRRGLVHVPEDRGLFADLTVDEHLRIVRRNDRSPDPTEVFDHLPGLVPLRNRRAGLLSGGEQQQLALARGLLAGPRVLLVDEMSLGLAPMVAADLLALVRGIATERGTAVVLVEQHVRAAIGIADRVALLRRGRLVASGAAADIDGRLDEIERGYLD